MTFAEPRYLLLAWVVPGLVVVMVWAWRRQRRAAGRFAQPEMLGRLVPPSSGARRWGRAMLFLTAIACLVTGAARPQWGEYYEEVSTRGVDIFVLLDVSQSMLADDVAPNRLERAKSDIRDFLAEVRGDRVGLIVFAGTAVIEVPLTADHDFFLSLLEHVGVDSATRGGSMIGDAIRKSLDAFDRRAGHDRVLLILSDGEDQASFPDEAAAQAAAAGVKIFTVGLGDTDEGHRIPIRDEAGNQIYLRHEGQEVWSRLDESLLKRIALNSGGAYIPARTRSYDLGQIYRDQLSQLTRGDLESRRQKKKYEQYQPFVALGLALLLLEATSARYPRRRKRRQ